MMLMIRNFSCFLTSGMLHCQTYSFFLAFIQVADRSWDVEEWYTTLVHQAMESSEVSKNNATRHDLCRGPNTGVPQKAEPITTKREKLPDA